METPAQCLTGWTGPPGQTCTIIDKDSGALVAVTDAAGYVTTATAPTTVNREAFDLTVLSAHTAAAFSTLSRTLTFHGQPLEHLTRTERVPFDEDNPWKVATATLAFMDGMDWLDVDYEVFGDEIVFVTLRWSVPDARSPDARLPGASLSLIESGGRLLGPDSHTLAVGFYDLMRWTVAHETAEWVTRDGQLVVDPHGQGNPLGIGIARLEHPAWVQWRDRCLCLAGTTTAA